MGCLKLTYYDEGVRLRPAGPDPLAEKYSSYSPYNYVLNNPVRYIDPDGRAVQHFDCYYAAMVEMQRIQYAENVEVMAFLLEDGSVAILPTSMSDDQGNVIYQNTIDRVWFDRDILDTTSPGKATITIEGVVYRVIGTVHTHFESPRRSDDYDLTMQRTFPWLDHYILFEDGVYNMPLWNDNYNGRNPYHFLYDRWQDNDPHRHGYSYTWEFMTPFWLEMH